MISAARLLMLATAFGTVFMMGVLAEPASAQSEVCKAAVTEVTGPRQLAIRRSTKEKEKEGDGKAMDNAVASWERAVKAKFGEQWATWSKAKNTTVDCAQTKTRAFVRCTISGRPCAPAASLGTTEDAGGSKTGEKDGEGAMPRGSRGYVREMARQMRLALQRRAAELSAHRREEARQRHAAERRQRTELTALERENARQRYLTGQRDWAER